MQLNFTIGVRGSIHEIDFSKNLAEHRVLAKKNKAIKVRKT